MIKLITLVGLLGLAVVGSGLTQRCSAKDALAEGPLFTGHLSTQWHTMRPVDDCRRAAEFKHDAVKHLADVTEATAGPMVELILVDDDPSIIEACSPLVDRTIHVKPFSWCSALTR